MTIETLISRLDGVRETGSGKYLARCPAHDDRNPSLAIKDGDDGRVLVHCFAGCGTAEVLVPYPRVHDIHHPSHFASPRTSFSVANCLATSPRVGMPTGEAHMSVISVAAEVSNPRSLSNRFRQKRFRRFESLCALMPRPLRIIDIGGTAAFWKQRG